MTHIFTQNKYCLVAAISSSIACRKALNNRVSAISSPRLQFGHLITKLIILPLSGHRKEVGKWGSGEVGKWGEGIMNYEL
jgi:hypothetical protein